MLLYQGYTAKQLNVEYSPSSCIEDINVFIKQYINQSTTAQAKANSTQTLKSNLAYGAESTQVIDLFLPTTTAQKKLHIYIHGGYWQELSKDESSFAATTFQQHGVHFAVINYTLAPNASLSEIVEECRQAVKWLATNSHLFGYDEQEIYLSGSSAGAHLAAMVALDNTIAIKGICAVSGVYDLTPIQHTYINEPLQLSAAEVASNSPLFMLEQWPEECACIVAYGDNETNEFKRQSQAFYHQLKQLGQTASLKEIKARNHFDVILDLANDHSILFKLVQKQMQLS